MLEDLLAANEIFADGFSPEIETGRPRLGVALVMCMDTRIEPLAVFGIRPGDTKILRNAGGRVTNDVLRSLTLAVEMLGVQEIAVVHHTSCALAGSTEEGVRAQLSAEALMSGLEWLAMPEPDVALAADVARVRSFPALAHLRSEGWRYDVVTGRVSVVVPADASGEGPA